MEFAATDNSSCKYKRVRTCKPNGRRSSAEARALAQYQPCRQALGADSQWPARRINGAHAAIVGIEIISQTNFACRNIGERIGLFLEVELGAELLLLVQKILIVHLRLAVAETYQFR